jgi:hypothetical protein
MSLRVLAVIVLGCCLVATVSALSGPCPAFGPIHRGSLGVNSDYWGMSAADIVSYATTHASGTSTESAYVKAPPLVLPTSGADKFSSLSGIGATIGDSPTIPSTFSGALLPDILPKPSFSGSGNPYSIKTGGSTLNSIFL